MLSHVDRINIKWRQKNLRRGVGKKKIGLFSQPMCIIASMVFTAPPLSCLAFVWWVPGRFLVHGGAFCANKVTVSKRWQSDVLKVMPQELASLTSARWIWLQLKPNYPCSILCVRECSISPKIPLAEEAYGVSVFPWGWFFTCILCRFIFNNAVVEKLMLILIHHP